MRIKLGRPDIGAYRDRFDVPAADPDSELSVTWLGVSTLLIDDGTSAIMTDGFFSRPSMLDVGLRRLTPSNSRIDWCLTKAKVNRLAAVIPVHTHYDHALDTAIVAERTGATIVGGESAANIARGHGFPESRIVVAGSGDQFRFGPFQVTLIESNHCPPDRFPGAITSPVAPPAKASEYRCGEAWSILIHHEPSDRRMLVQGSAGFAPNALTHCQAGVVYLGAGQLGAQPEDYITEYWSQTVGAVGARRVVLIHWDDFFRPLTEPLRALPHLGDNLDASMRVLTRLARKEHVALHFPTVWHREDPWL